MTIRAGDRRGQVKGMLMDAALELVMAGQHFASLSIREIARQAGVVPTSFYRHFRDMDDLGLALVDELSLVLRKLMRDARERAPAAGQMIRRSVDVYVQHVDEHQPYFLFLSQEMSGGSRGVRQAIRGELNFFANELLADLGRFRLLPHLSLGMLEITAQTAIQMVAGSTMEILDAERGSAQREAVRQRLVRQLQMVFIAAANWRERSSNASAQT
jgi:AcrR family transcriptional regulator